MEQIRRTDPAYYKNRIAGDKRLARCRDAK